MKEVTKGKNWPVRIEVTKDGSGKVIKQKSIQIPKLRRLR